MKYRPEIDALRCWAVIPVILFHLQDRWMPGGYLGVDVFFVISGFLITSIMLVEMEDDRFSLRAFWGRRIRRILPAAAFVLLATTLINAAFLYHPDLREFTSEKLAALFSYSNLFFWWEKSNYWAAMDNISPYLNFWSLSVEEQFYLFYPLFLLIAFKCFRQRILPLIGILTFISLALFVYGAKTYPRATFYLLPMRGWELGVGCMLALASRHFEWPKSRLLALSGLGLVALMYALSSEHHHVGLNALVATFGAVLFIASYDPQQPIGLITNRLTIGIGRISYSLYLWHWPIIALTKLYNDESGNELGLGFILSSTLACSLVSYFLVEKPLRRAKRATPLIIATALVIGAFIYTENHALNTSNYGVNMEWEDSLARDQFLDRGLVKAPNPGPPLVVLMGDSHAEMWSTVFDEITDELAINSSQWTVSGLNPLFNAPYETHYEAALISPRESEIYQQRRMALIGQWHPRLIIFGARWKMMSLEEIDYTIRYLSEHADQVVLIESPPLLLGFGNRQYASIASFRGQSLDGDLTHTDFESLAAVRQLLVAVAAPYPNCSVMEIADLYLSNNGVQTIQDGAIYYHDDDHLTPAGAQLAKERFKALILEGAAK